MAATKTFWTSFLDGLTGAGIFGDLRIPGNPARLFKEEPEEITPKLPANWGAVDIPSFLADREAALQAERQVHEYAKSVTEAKRPRFYGGGLPYDSEQIAIHPLGSVAVHAFDVDVNGEHVKIARDREKGWVIVAAPAMHEATERPAR